MGVSYLLLIALTVSPASPGSSIQTSQDVSDPVRRTRVDGVSGGVPLLRPGSGGDPAEGSGATQQLPKALEQHTKKNLSAAARPAFALSHLGGRNGNGTPSPGPGRSLIGGGDGNVLEELTESQPGISDAPIGDDIPELSPKTQALPPLTNVKPPCLLGLSPCVELTNFNGTNLLWDDMRRTLAFAWEIHVFGSAGLFILLVAAALVGMAGAMGLPYPLCDTMTLANSLLSVGGTLRAIHLLLDPYGTRQILNHATLAALHNVPMHLLLWALVTLSLVSRKGLKLVLFPLPTESPWVAGLLAISHCTLLSLADLYSPDAFPTLPLLLQALSLCWGFPFCTEMLTKSISSVDASHNRSPVPHWAPSQRIERRARRVTAACAFLGVLCCGLQFNSLLWIYGLTGNWRRFGWGWWLSQFWARLLELAWGFSLLTLGSWIFWTPSRAHLSGNHWPGQSEAPEEVEGKSFLCRKLAGVHVKKSEKRWADLMPNNWVKYQLSRRGIGGSIMCPYADQPPPVGPDYKSDSIRNGGPDPQAALLWQKVGERECILSLIEFEMRPPSPIELRRSIDNALHHGQLLAGGLFTVPPPSWTYTMGQGVADGENAMTFPPPYAGYGWMADTESIPTSLDHFQTSEVIQPPQNAGDHHDHAETSIVGDFTEEFNQSLSALLHSHSHYWSEEDVTDL